MHHNNVNETAWNIKKEVISHKLLTVSGKKKWASTKHSYRAMVNKTKHSNKQIYCVSHWAGVGIFWIICINIPFFASRQTACNLEMLVHNNVAWEQNDYKMKKMGELAKEKYVQISYISKEEKMQQIHFSQMLASDETDYDDDDTKYKTQNTNKVLWKVHRLLSGIVINEYFRSAFDIMLCVFVIDVLGLLSRNNIILSIWFACED